MSDLFTSLGVDKDKQQEGLDAFVNKNKPNWQKMKELMYTKNIPLKLTEDVVTSIHTCDTLFAELDKNKDGELDMDEFTAYIKQKNDNES